jgi:hypothetical protein
MSRAGSTKSKTKKATATVVEIPTILIEEISHPTPPPPAKKKSTKKPPVVAAVTPDGIVGNLTPVTERRPLIAHLPIKGHELETDLFVSDEKLEEDEAATCGGGGNGGHGVHGGNGGNGGSGINGSGSGNGNSLQDQPYPFEAQESFTSLQAVETMCAGSGPTPMSIATKTAPKTEIVSRPSLPLHYSERLMVRFQDANRDQVLPESTDVACFWDCTTFRGSPCVIPVGIEEGIWRVYGNFCCPECAAAYLFSERLDSHVQWERYALLNRLYASPKDGSCVRLAPPRTVLRLFGGSMEVADFRSALETGRMRIDVMTPPMISIIQVMDTKPIDFYDASMKNNFIPWEMDRQNRPGAQGLRLRRTKPIAEKESTLEFCMGIQKA